MANGKRTISILGSTGSIGVQTLRVLDLIPSSFNIGYLTANYNFELLEEQAEKYNPIGVVIKDVTAFKEFKKHTNFKGMILPGDEGIIEAATFKQNDLVISALVGFSGVLPTLASIKSGTDIALANKETLVSAGQIITKEAKENNINIIAVDSEHSAVLQCIAGESAEEIEKIILTASGGPFRSKPIEEFNTITVAQALEHPNWTMGNKITIDSATLINKGFEVIEAHWLFNMPVEKIEVIIHPQSIIHSMVQFIDGSIKAQLGVPDMRIPIAYAINFPHRLSYNFPRLNLEEIEMLTFEKPDLERFPCLKMAYDAIKTGGTAPAILNASNEIAVYAFLDKKISITEIPILIEDALNKIKVIANPTIKDIIETDQETRNFVVGKLKT